MNISEIAQFVKNAHAGQTDRAGVPYFNHILTVSKAVRTYGIDYEIVGLLHDILEDTSVTREDLERLGIDKHIIEAVVILTKTPGEPYDDYLKRIKQNRIAKVVKLADLKHNSEVSRIASPTEKDISRTQKYKHASKYLSDDDTVSDRVNEILQIIGNDYLIESTDLDAKITALNESEHNVLMSELEEVIKVTTPSW